MPTIKTNPMSIIAYAIQNRRQLSRTARWIHANPTTGTIVITNPPAPQTRHVNPMTACATKPSDSVLLRKTSLAFTTFQCQRAGQGKP